MIQCNHLSIGYGTRVIQHDLSFVLPDGTITALLGANGCGKSTLLKTIAGLQPVLAGNYHFAPTADAPLSKQIALVLTERVSVESATVQDVVAMGRYPYTSFLGTLTTADQHIVQQAMEQVGVAQLANTFYNDHSDGEKQRILIAKALAQQTPIILLDEPTAHLDLPSRIKTLTILREIAHKQGKTILISTHELDLAMRTADSILLMFPPNQGMVLDTPEHLRSTDAFVRAFGMEISDFTTNTELR